MRNTITIATLIGLFLFSWWMWGPTNSAEYTPSIAPPIDDYLAVPESLVDPEVMAQIESKSDLILLKSPVVNSVVTSPFLVSGLARGQWFFEGSFPLVLTDWEGKVLAEGYARAQGNSLTASFVPFRAELDFDYEYKHGDPEYKKNGSLILQKDNPSGLSENDDSLEIPIHFAD